MKLNRIFLAILLFTFTTPLFSQINYDGSFGDGIKLKTNDNSFYLKFRTRVQPLWQFEYNAASGIYENKGSVKRARLKFDGYFINKDLRYKIEYDVVGGYVRDAMIKYRMGNFDVWFGQGKLPGNRERVVSSGDLETVDRSIYNKNYTMDRDIGLQLHHHFSIGNFLIRDIYAVTSGKGILDNDMSEGLSYTAKLEFLPLGKFTKKGDYVMSDIYREKSPKLSFAAYGNYNTDAYKDKGQLGDDLGSQADLLLFGADMLFKYRGFSFMTEVGSREVTAGDVWVYNAQDDKIANYYVGSGMNVQTGYVLKNMWGITARYAFTDPLYKTFNYKIEDYTLAVSKYIKMHKFKIQADFTYRRIGMTTEMFIARLQMEMQF